MRVLFVTNMWPEANRPHWGTFIRSQAASLEAAGLSIDVLVIRGYASRSAYMSAIPQLVRRGWFGAYDVVHIHTGHAALVALWATKRPIVISFVGGDVLGNRHEAGVEPKSRLLASLLRQLAVFASATITKSREMEDSLPFYARPRNVVIPNGVDIAAFAPRAKDDARRALGWSSDERVVLFLGDPNDPRKNLALARDAVGLVSQDVPTIRLHAAFGISPDSVPELMWAADCLALPSRSEGSPNVVKEAMAAALPIVATPVGDVPERLSGVEGCFVVSSTGGPREFANAIRAAIAIDRAPAARRAVEPVSLENVARQVIAVYESVLHGSNERRVNRDV